MSLELVISDLDGTILETEDYHRRAYNALFAELGVVSRWSKDDYSARLAQVGGEKFGEIFSWLGRPQDEFADTKARLYARKTALYTELIVADLTADALPLRPGVARLFAELRGEGIPLAIASTCVKAAAVAVIRAALGEAFLTGLAGLFAGDDVVRKKPHPDIYLLAAARCGVATRDCLVFEDTVHGLQAARAAGMCCVVTPSEFARDDDFDGAQLVVANLDEREPVDVARLRSLVRG